MGRGLFLPAGRGGLTHYSMAPAPRMTFAQKPFDYDHVQSLFLKFIASQNKESEGGEGGYRPRGRPWEPHGVAILERIFLKA